MRPTLITPTNKGNHVEVPYWPSSTPGLAVVEALGHDEQPNGYFVVVHQSTGIALGMCSASPENAMRMASEAASDDTGWLPWDLPATALRAEPRYARRCRQIAAEHADVRMDADLARDIVEDLNA